MIYVPCDKNILKWLKGEPDPTGSQTLSDKAGQDHLNLHLAVHGSFVRAIQYPLDNLDSLHEGMVHIAHLVLPCTESAAGINAIGLQPRLDNRQGTVPSHGRYRIRIGDIDEIAADDLAALFLGYHSGINQTLDRIFDDPLLVHRFMG